MYSPKENKTYEAEVARACRYAMKATGEHDPTKMAVAVEVVAYYKIPVATKAKTRLQMLAEKILPTKKPDVDNIAKSVMDGMNGVAYNDDAQVTDLYVCKRYSGEPKVCVRVKTIGEGDE